jgi:hypothetical protein
MEKIIQIMPADGWVMIEAYEKIEKIYIERLISWALIKETDGSHTLGGFCLDSVGYPELLQADATENVYRFFCHESDVERRKVQIVEAWKNECRAKDGSRNYIDS